MKTIVLIEKDAAADDSVGGVFKKWSRQVGIIAAPDEQSAIVQLAKQQVDLVVCNLVKADRQQTINFSRLCSSFPYIPFIAIVAKGLNEASQVMNLGASHYFQSPVDADQLLQRAGELLETSTSGTVKGIPVHSFLQMLENEEKTCSLKIFTEGATGFIYIRYGLVIAAQTKDLQDEEAAYAILSWENAVIEIKYFNPQCERRIHKPLMSLILEACRLKDERESLLEKQRTEKRPKLHLKHISTVGNRIALEIGTKIKLEVDAFEEPMLVTMVGMLPDRYIIVTAPDPVEVMRTARDQQSRIVVTFVHLGRLCLFKTTARQLIEDPSPMLFLDYPPVIHYHELRRSKRTVIFLPCSLHGEEAVETLGVLIDLSTSGGLCRIKHKENVSLPPLEIDGKIRLRCLLPGLQEEQEVLAIVKNIKKNTSETRVGIEFIDLHQRAKDAITRYLNSLESAV